MKLVRKTLLGLAAFAVVIGLTSCADLAGKQSKYFLQQFKDSGDLISENLCGYTNEELRQICESIKQKGYNVTVRGV